MKKLPKVRKWALSIAGLGLASFLLFSGQASATAQTTKTITIKMTSIRILDEDDPISNDEPYLINIGVRAKVQLSGGKASLVPGTLSVQNVGSLTHNDLGHSGDNWADEVNSYGVGSSQSFTAVVPRTEAGWIVGVVSVMFEEDGFSNSTANLLRSKIKDAVQSAITNLSISGIDTNSITQAVVQKVTRDLSRAAKNFDIGGIIRGIASAVDPDDFGGINIVLATTLAGGAVMEFAGPPPSDLSVLPPLKIVPAGSPVSFSLAFPVGVPSSVPYNASYRGSCRVNGHVSQSG